MKCGKLKSFLLLTIFLGINMLCLCGCKSENIRLYDISTGTISALNLEDYVAGATSAEIDESFSAEAICAQAVLCRTMALWAKNYQKCGVEGADISNDTSYFQGYTKDIPQKIRDCVNKTKGMVIKYNDQLIFPYYCSNSGGETSLASDVFGAEESYTYQTQSLETEENSRDYLWSASVSKSTILFAMQSLGKKLATANTFEISKVDDAGRAIDFSVGGVTVSANNFRQMVGNNILRSCKITSIIVSENSVDFSGVGYGHGVGLSQWGANILASNNYTYKDILLYYYKNCQVVKN
jgi:stage II sporulation protein D